MRTWLTPPTVKPGDVVGVVAPSDAVTKEYVMNGITVLTSWGLRVKLGKHLFESESDFAAGSPEERMSDLMEMWLDPAVKVIWAGLGGYSVTQLWPLIDQRVLEVMRANPKWLIGYSDICILLNILFGIRVRSLHGPNLSSLADWDETSKTWLYEILFSGKIIKKEIRDEVFPLVEGAGRGRLLISNLESLITSFGTRFDPLATGEEDLILGFEELRQYKSTIQRQMDMVLNHKKASRIKGIIVGRLSDLITKGEYKKWNERNKIEDILVRRVLAVNEKLPVVSFSKFGHLVEGVTLKEKIKLLGKQQTFLTFVNGTRVFLRTNGHGPLIKIVE